MTLAKWAGIIPILFLTACAPTLPKPDVSIAPKVVKVVVSKPCIPKDVPPAPKAYPDDKLTSDTPADERYLAIAAANLMRKARLLLLEPLVEACR